jgi:hypothetical protein
LKPNMRVIGTVCFSLFMGSASLLAHHSAAATYDVDKKMTLTGTITKLEWKNPHIFYYIDVKGPQGAMSNWAIEGTAPNQLYRRGWRKEDIKIGDSVTLADASPARNGTTRAYGGTLTLPNGKQVFSGSAATDR